MTTNPTPAPDGGKRNRTTTWVVLGTTLAAVAAAAVTIPLMVNASQSSEAPATPSASPSVETMATESAPPSSTASAPANTGGATSQAAAPTDATSAQAAPAYMTIGEASAPVEVTVYSDYLCPHCATFQRDVESKLEPLIADGTVKLLVQDLVVVDENASTQLAIAARAAGEQGVFHEFYIAAMEYQPKIHEKRSLDLNDLLTIAEHAGVPDLDRFTTDLSSPTIAEGVQESITEAVNAGVDSTPTVLVNGVKLDNPGYEQVRAAIDAAK